MALKTIPNPIIVANKEEPPYDMMGKGDPTIGSKPKTIDRFTTIWRKRDVEAERLVGEGNVRTGLCESGRGEERRHGEDGERQALEGRLDGLAHGEEEVCPPWGSKRR